MLGSFSCVLSSADFFFQNRLSKKILQNYHQSVKQFGSRSVQTFGGPDPGPNCLQRLSADDTGKQRAKVAVGFGKVNSSVTFIPPKVFFLKMSPALYVCCIYSIALVTRFYHGSKHYEPW